MADQVFNKDNSNLDAAEETITENTATNIVGESVLFHYFNGLDENVDVVVTASRASDDDFSEGVQLNSETVSSGGNAGFYVVTDPWEQVEISLTPSSDPTSGSLTVYRMTDN